MEVVCRPSPNETCTFGLTLSKGLGRLLHFSLAVVLQYGSGLLHPGRNIKCRHSTVFFFLENTVLFSTFFTVTSYSCKVYHSFIVSSSLRGNMLICIPFPLRFSVFSYFLFLYYHVYHGYEGYEI
jgi:hypothetical protein